MRLQAFKNRTRFGPSFPCITCHQTLFRNQVMVFDEKVKEVLKNECSEPLYKRTLSFPNDNFYITIKGDTMTKGNPKNHVPYQISITSRHKNTPQLNGCDGLQENNNSKIPSPGSDIVGPWGRCQGEVNDKNISQEEPRASNCEDMT